MHNYKKDFFVVEEDGEDLGGENQTSEDEDGDNVCSPVIVPDEDIEEERIHVGENIPDNINTLEENITIADVDNQQNVPEEISDKQSDEQEET